jgi:lactoylglutathione lyase
MKSACLLLLLSLFGPASIAQEKKPRINHIAFSVLDLKKSASFYQALIGLDTIPEPFHDNRHAWFSIGDGAALHLIQNPPPLVVPIKNTHLCFSVPHLAMFIERLKKSGIAYEDWPGKLSAITKRADGVQQIYLQDPDGYWLEVNDDYK